MSFRKFALVKYIKRKTGRGYVHSVPQTSYAEDEGRSLEIGFQERVSNHFKLLW